MSVLFCHPTLYIPSPGCHFLVLYILLEHCGWIILSYPSLTFVVVVDWISSSLPKGRDVFLLRSVSTRPICLKNDCSCASQTFFFLVCILACYYSLHPHHWCTELIGSFMLFLTFPNPVMKQILTVIYRKKQKRRSRRTKYGVVNEGLCYLEQAD